MPEGTPKFLYWAGGTSGDHIRGVPARDLDLEGEDAYLKGDRALEKALNSPLYRRSKPGDRQPADPTPTGSAPKSGATKEG